MIKSMLISFAVCFVVSALWTNWKNKPASGVEHDEHEDLGK